MLALDSAWARSYATSDTALANKLFDDSLIVTGGNGRLKDKKGEMADVGPLPPGFQIHHFRTSDVRGAGARWCRDGIGRVVVDV